eukprot:745825-Alexandrium_andersonii.AAC.1
MQGVGEVEGFLAWKEFQKEPSPQTPRRFLGMLHGAPEREPRRTLGGAGQAEPLGAQPHRARARLGRGRQRLHQAG